MSAKSEDDPNGIARIVKRPENNIPFGRGWMIGIITVVSVLLVMYTLEFKLNKGRRLTSKEAVTSTAQTQPLTFYIGTDFLVERTVTKPKKARFSIEAINGVKPQFIVYLNSTNNTPKVYPLPQGFSEDEQDYEIERYIFKLVGNQGLKEARLTYWEID